MPFLDRLPQVSVTPGAFLTARWESLVLLNYRCPAAVLEPLVPWGTSLDLWAGEALVSLVGFRFVDTRLKGVPIPWHRDFDEVNLRFYVRREHDDGTLRRAVVFVRELVPRVAIAFLARWLYNEPYLRAPMSHTVHLDSERGGEAVYVWRHRSSSFAISASVTGPASPLVPGSEAEFITEHYWGYTRQRDGSTLEYRVEHPPWRVWQAATGTFTGPASALYGAAFADVLAAPPRSIFVAVGSPVTVHAGRKLADAR